MPFPEYLMPFKVRKVARLQCFSCSLTLNSGQQSFSRLLNSDCSIQISGAAAIRKVLSRTINSRSKVFEAITFLVIKKIRIVLGKVLFVELLPLIG